MSTTLKFVLDTRRAKDNGTYPLRLRIMHNRVNSHISLGYSLSEKEWDGKNERLRSSSKSYGNVSRFNNDLQSRKAKYFEIIGELERDGILDNLSASQLKGHLEKKPKGNVSFGDFIQQQYELKLNANKSGTARTYKDLANFLRRYNDGNLNLSFVEIDYNFLVQLEHQHIGKGNQYSSLSVYLRTLRSLYNEAIKMGLVNEKHYPFTKYKIKEGQPRRSALTKKNFQLVKKAEFKQGSAKQIGRDFYLASFYLHGMNWMDMCLLRYENLSDDLNRLQYVRKKTGKPFNLKVSEPLIDAINSLKTFDASNRKDFIFPVLKLEDDPEKYVTKINNRRLKINKYLKMVAQDLDISSFSIYSARHTYATMLWENSGSAAVTQRSLGHKTEEQTQEYLSYFGNDKVDSASDDLFEIL
ncbi:MAG: site-specific integrase [Cytophagales bacterium]|nr:site-specific integrase [Cytophagales bacterium]